MKNSTKQLLAACEYGEFEKIQCAIRDGADVNAIGQLMQTPLMMALNCEAAGDRISIVQLLLENGANPDFRGDEDCGVLFYAILLKDPKVLELILKAGANPNILLDDGQTLYDWADFDYQDDEFQCFMPLPSTNQDQISEEAWLDYMDRCADKKGVRSPDHLRVMRKFGAKTSIELRNEVSN